MYSRAYVRIWTLRYPDSANVPISSKKKKNIIQVHLFGSFLIGRLLKATKGLLPPWCLWFSHGKYFGHLNDQFLQADYKLKGSKAILVVPTQKRNITAKIQNVNEPCYRILRRRLVCVVTMTSTRFTLCMLGFMVMLHDCSLSSHDIHKTGLGPFKRRIVFLFYFHEPNLIQITWKLRPIKIFQTAWIDSDADLNSSRTKLKRRAENRCS